MPLNFFKTRFSEPIKMVPWQFSSPANRVAFLAYFISFIGITSSCEFNNSVLIDGTCFRVNENKLSWVDAKASCVSWGGVFSRIDTMAKFTGINALQYVALWIGAHAPDQSNDWLWADNQKNASELYDLKMWGVTYPKVGSSYCALFNLDPGGGIFTNENCTRTFKSVCMEIATSTTTTTEASTTQTSASGETKITTTEESTVRTSISGETTSLSSSTKSVDIASNSTTVAKGKSAGFHWGDRKLVWANAVIGIFSVNIYVFYIF